MATKPFAGLTLARVLRPWGRRGQVAAEIFTDFPQRLVALRDAWLSGPGKPARPVHVLSCRIHVGQAIFHFAGSQTINDAELLRGLEVQVPLAERAVLGAGHHYISELVGCTVWEQAAPRSAGIDHWPTDGQRLTDDVPDRVSAKGENDGATPDAASAPVAGANAAPLGTVADVQRIDPGGVGRGVLVHGGLAEATSGSPLESWVLSVATPRGELLIPFAADICTRIDTAARRIEVRLPAGLADLNNSR